ncbi:exonuclease SbcCD subunit D [Actinomadura sp. HBU206391]|uniref:exonuclease SbcCD subunit D n=1 Tax=Actinomadura sp. HBU206391 TaxID=2731692 RepID=UPI00164FE28B|nr:exonuclease SbcCD subunit D [Actinomadura sp. HBU206391]MBC6460458.1 exonuclease SbcCD subunit D [Actinomadura sp. HBU206391]
MRLLHTSDWHLGRSFHREDLLGAQAAFVDHLVETVRAERVDCVLVSGDVYDRALPPVDAVRLCDEALRRLAELSRVVLIAGNHDSAQRLGFGAGLMDSAGVHVRADPASVGEPVLVPAGGETLAVYGIPYLEPELLRAPWNLDARGHTAAMTEAMRRVRADLAGRGGRAVVLAHAFVTGGEPSDSERDISVGGVSHVPAGVFEGVDYVALGHLHGRQTMTETVRYSGSPLAYSFSETRQLKGSWLVELPPERADGGLAAEFVEAPVPRRLARLRGRLDDLLTSPAHARYEDHWLQVVLTDPHRPPAAMERLRGRFPHTLALGFEPEGAGAGGGRSWSERIRERSDLDIARDFVAEVSGEPAGEAERALLHEAFEACRVKEATA